MPLIFEYCECGCHGSDCERINYWIGNAAGDKVSLHRGHGCMSPKIGEFNSYGAAVDHATELAREFLVREQKILDEIRRQVKPAKPPKVLTFEQEIRAQFPGKDNAGVRRLIRDSSGSRSIRLLARSVAFTELGRAKLELVAKACDRVGH